MHEPLQILADPPAPADEVTLYVPGFTKSADDSETFGGWRAAHTALAAGGTWGPKMAGYAWESGAQRIPTLTLTLWARSAWRVARGATAVTPAGAVLFATECALEYGAWMLREYHAARTVAEADADALASTLHALRGDHARVRVVAHSLGCRHLLEAMKVLDADAAPDEVHLCAPAFAEAEYGAELAALPRGEWYLYHAQSDAVLGFLFWAAEGLGGGEAVGRVGLAASYPRVQAYDVARHFGVRVHGEYSRRFPMFAATGVLRVD